MRNSRRAAAVAAILGAAALLAALTPRGADYGVRCPRDFCNDPAHAIYDLATWNIDGFFANQPTMGPVSLVLRAPFAAVGREMGGDQLAEMYRFGTFACLAATGLLGLLALGLTRPRRNLLLGASLVGLWMLGPGTVRAVWLGHPEEVLAAALAIAGVVAARSDRAWLGAVLVGLAVATKQWGLLAMAPLALAAAPGARARAVVVAGAVALAVTLPMAVGDLDAFRQATADAVSDVATTTQTNVWWPVTAHRRNDPPQLLGDLAHPLVFALAISLGLAVWFRQREAARDHALVLLALVLLLRCVLDLYTFSYHHAPFILALAAWEVITCRRAPWVALGASAFLSVTIWEAVPHWNAWTTWAFYCVWTLPLAAWLTVRVMTTTRQSRAS